MDNNQEKSHKAGSSDKLLMIVSFVMAAVALVMVLIFVLTQTGGSKKIDELRDEGNAFMKSGEYSRALDSYENAYKQQNNEDILTRIIVAACKEADLTLSEGRYDEALAKLGEIYTAYPDKRIGAKYALICDTYSDELSAGFVTIDELMAQSGDVNAEETNTSEAADTDIVADDAENQSVVESLGDPMGFSELQIEGIDFNEFSKWTFDEFKKYATEESGVIYEDEYGSDTSLYRISTKDNGVYWEYSELLWDDATVIHWMHRAEEDESTQYNSFSYAQTELRLSFFCPKRDGFPWPGYTIDDLKKELEEKNVEYTVSEVYAGGEDWLNEGLNIKFTTNTGDDAMAMINFYTSRKIRSLILIKYINE